MIEEELYAINIADMVLLRGIITKIKYFLVW